MEKEQEEGPKLNPFERLGVLYEETLDPSDRFLRGRVNLKKNIVMLISPRPWNGDPIESFDVCFFSKDGELGFSFEISKDGHAECISFPLIVTIEGTKQKEYSGIVVIRERDKIEGSAEEKIGWAEVLVDWLDKIVKENEFSEPPITASIHGVQK